MYKNFILAILFLFAFSTFSNAQSYSLDWTASFSGAAWPSASTNNTATNVGTSGINITVGVVNTVPAAYQNSSPVTGTTGGIAWTLPGTTAGGPLVLWADWANLQQKVTTTITFTSPVANPVFYVGDIDKSDATVTATTNYLDRVVVTGTTPSATTLNATVTKFNAGSTMVLVSGNDAHADGTANVGGNAPTNAASGAAQDATVQFTITGTVSSITIVWDNNNNAVNGVNPSTQAVVLGDVGFTKTVPISGVVYNDRNGNLTKDAGENGIKPGTLFVNVTDVATGTVIGVATVNADGTYSLPNIASNANVSIRLSNTAASLGSLTTPAVATASGYAATTALTITAASTGTAGLTNQNFGLDQLPIPAAGTYANQTNPGGTVSVTVPPATFSVNDPDGGSTTSIRISAFPTNATSITINGITYTSATFPLGGVSVPTNAAGQPTQTISVDPATGIVDVVFPYFATDNAGKESAISSNITVQFTTVLPVRLISFSGNTVNNTVVLNWSAANELNLSRYEVEKSTDGVRFTKIGQVTANNVYGTTQQYSFTDGAVNGSAYYRLRSVDIDGAFTYSAVLKIDANGFAAGKISNVVNPFSGEISFQYNAATAQVIQITVADATGRIQHVEKQSVRAGVNKIAVKGLQGLANGNYFLKVISADNTVETSKLIKQ